jgi:RNA-directed DNA polymerase
VKGSGSKYLIHQNNLKEGRLEMELNEGKTVPIEYEWVSQAYFKVREGGKAVGIDKESWEDFEKDMSKNLYLIWNRLSSGSYFPPAVRETEIPKKDGTMRKLGIPTMRDRISQEVVRKYMEERIDRLFHEHSYGYRPMKSAHQAIREVKSNCYKYNWVIDMDITKFFDEVNHEIMMRAVEHVIQDRWVHTYVKRWLEAPVQLRSGEIKGKEGKGTPQGGVISPLLSNLYLHFTLDKWLEKKYPEVSFIRYADDVVIHCRSKEEAEEVLAAIRTRLAEVKLSIKENKTKIVYCKDYRRKAEHEHVQFDFLGFSFKPVKLISQRGNKEPFVGFSTDLSMTNQKRITEVIRAVKALKNTSCEMIDISSDLHNRIVGWIRYYAPFGKRGLIRVLSHLDWRILKWMRKKYRIGWKEAITRVNRMRIDDPNLFYHWDFGKRTNFDNSFTTRAV